GTSVFGSTASAAGFGIADGWTLENSGSFTWVNGNFYLGFNGNAPGGRTIRNDKGGTFDIADAGGQIVMYGTNDEFDNAGTVNTDGLSGAATIGVTFNNTGTVNATSGTLILAGGGSSTGTWNASAGAAVQFTGGTFTLNGGSSTGLGALVVAGNATVTVASNTNF